MSSVGGCEPVLIAFASSGEEDIVPTAVRLVAEPGSTAAEITGGEIAVVVSSPDDHPQES